MKISRNSISTYVLMDPDWLKLSHLAADLVEHMGAVGGEDRGESQTTFQMSQPKRVTYYFRSQHTYQNTWPPIIAGN